MEFTLATDFLLCEILSTDSINIKILNAGAWARSSDRISVTLPMELEDYIPQVEEFYRHKHSGRKLQWHHLMSNGIVSLAVSPPPSSMRLTSSVPASDHLLQRHWEVRHGGDHVPNGCALCLEPAAKRPHQL